MDQKRFRPIEEAAKTKAETELLVYAQKMANVGAFKYLGRLLFTNDDDWPEVVTNLSKVQKKWIRVLLIMSQELVDTETSRMFFKAVG